LNKYRSSPTLDRLAVWPQVWAPSGASYWGPSISNPLNSEGAPLLFQPTLPPLFNQWAVFSSPEWMTMILYAHGLYWQGLKDWLKMFGGPGFDIFGFLAGPDKWNMETNFGEWWEWHHAMPSQRWPDPPDTLGIDEVAPYLYVVLGLAYPFSPVLGDSPFGYMLKMGGEVGFPGTDRIAQPVFTLQAATYPIQKIRLVGQLK